MILSRLHRLSPDHRDRLIRSLAPQAAFEQVGRLRQGGRVRHGADDLMVILKPELGELKVRMPTHRIEGDYAFLLDLDEHPQGQIELSFVQINDLFRPRYRIDLDERGRTTLLGTARRNVPEEVRAMEAGLGPGQVRHGLGAFGEFLDRLVGFCKAVDFVNILLEPLTYHNALMYERHGFVYVQGRKLMEQVDAGFKPGGPYERRLDGSTPFRIPGSQDDQRMRSWAIHDGILGRPLAELRMVFVPGSVERVCTYHASGEPAAGPASGAAAPREGGRA